MAEGGLRKEKLNARRKRSVRTDFTRVWQSPGSFGAQRIRMVAEGDWPPQRTNLLRRIAEPQVPGIVG